MPRVTGREGDKVKQAINHCISIELLRRASAIGILKHEAAIGY